MWILHKEWAWFDNLGKRHWELGLHPPPTLLQEYTVLIMNLPVKIFKRKP
jgi:hypothetical protein